MENLSTDFTCA